MRKVDVNNYKLCLLGSVSFVCGTVEAQTVEETNRTPHIILIMTDQQRGDALGCSGNAAIITPNLDKLANEGSLFTNAYTAAPSSTPARAGLLTGMSPWHHGLLGYGKVAEHYKYEMPQMLKDLSYHTLGIGKMHWNPQNVLHGFEATILDESGRVESPYFMSDYRKWFHLQALGLNPDSTGIGWNAHEAKSYALPERLHPTRWTADQAIEAIRNYDSAQSLFLKVSFARPHSPYDPPRRFVDMYNDKNIPAPVIGNWCENRPLDTHPENTPEAFAGNYGRDYAVNSRKYYYAAITFIDEQVGRIIEELKRKNMYDNALICFVSDHGDMLGDHNLWRKTYAYESSVAIPYIVKMPDRMKKGKKTGIKIEEPVELRDLLPTFLAINNAPVPQDMDGMSLLPLLEGQKNTRWRKYIDIEHATAYWDDNYWCALTDGKIKYIRFLRTGKEQLFDLTDDPHELRNLAGERSSMQNLEAMRQAMVQHLSERGDEWVNDGKLVIRKQSLLYSPNYPINKN